MFSRLLLLFILVPLVELAIFLWIGERVGLLNTLVIILLTGVLGAVLTKSQGLRVLSEFRQSTASGKLPHEPIIEGLIILVAGALLLTPGFLTDIIGFLALIPASRKMIQRYLTHTFAKKFKLVTPSSPSRRQTPRADDDNVIDV